MLSLLLVAALGTTVPNAQCPVTGNPVGNHLLHHTVTVNGRAYYVFDREAGIRLRRMGLRTVMITGDNAITAAVIAARAGVDALLRRNLRVWGLGGVLLPFVGIKLIDLALVGLRLTLRRLSMLRHFIKSLQLALISMGVCCVLYPLALWTVGHLLFRAAAEGSLVMGPDGAGVGSALIAQPFTKDEYFQHRAQAPWYGLAGEPFANVLELNLDLRKRYGPPS